MEQKKFEFLTIFGKFMALRKKNFAIFRFLAEMTPAAQVTTETLTFLAVWVSPSEIRF